MNPQDTDNEIRRLREAFASLAHDAGSTEGCPDPDRIWMAVRVELSPGEVRDLVEHTVACPFCAEAWRLARELNIESAPAAKTDGTLIARSMVSRRSAWRWGSIIAAAAVIMLVTVFSIQFDQSSEYLSGTPGFDSPRYREGGEATIRSLVPADRSLPRERFELAWSPGPPGTRYQLEIATADLDLVLKARGLEEAGFLVDENTLQPFPPGTRLLWQVEAAHPDGTRLTSETFVAVLQ
jgi:hypothetical protein